MREISDFEEDEFYGFCGDFEQKKDKGPSGFAKRSRNQWVYYPDIRGDTGERGDANENSEEKKNEIGNQIELMLGFEELTEKLNVREAGKFRKEIEEASR